MENIAIAEQTEKTETHIEDVEQPIVDSTANAENENAEASKQEVVADEMPKTEKPNDNKAKSEIAILNAYRRQLSKDFGINFFDRKAVAELATKHKNVAEVDTQKEVAEPIAETVEAVEPIVEATEPNAELSLREKLLNANIKAERIELASTYVNALKKMSDLDDETAIEKLTAQAPEFLKRPAPFGVDVSNNKAMSGYQKMIAEKVAKGILPASFLEK